MIDRLKVQNALWGLFISDSISMPAHWFYQLKHLRNVFGKIDGFNDAPHPHPESFMVGNSYNPNIKKADEIGRKYDILHKHIRFYDTPYNQLQIDTAQRAGEHKNAMPELDERYHYHHGLKAGENTLGANLVRVLMRSVVDYGEYKQEHFLNSFIEYMTTSNLNNDAYSEIYIRAWFENYSNGVAPELCAQEQKKVWSIGSHGGIIRALVLALGFKDSYTALGHAINHQNLTHRSENVSAALGVLVPLLHSLINGDDIDTALTHYASKVKLVKIKGRELSHQYASHNGPGNIPKDEMYKIHTEFSDEYLDLKKLLKEHSIDQLIGGEFATACYPEHGIPLLMSLIYNENFDFEKSIFANANAGGDNVHRGMILGLIVGAGTDEIAQHLKEQLINYEEIKKEIEEFSEIIKNKK